MMKNNRTHAITQDQWLKVIMSLSPTGIKNLENSLRQVRGNLESGGNSSPVSSTGGSAPSVSYRKGKTYENGRRNLKDEPVSEEESERRYKRRERNRVAAAKCRQRRQSQIDILQNQINGLRKSGNDLQSMLRSLSREKSDLNRMLTGHSCRMAARQQQQDSVLSDGLISMDTDYSFVEPNLETPVKVEVVGSDPPSPLVTRPSSLPLTSFENQALPHLSPLFTPSTVSFLNNTGTHQSGPTGTTGTTPSNEYMYQSIGYLNLLSPSLDHVNMLASPDLSQQLNTPLN